MTNVDLPRKSQLAILQRPAAKQDFVSYVIKTGATLTTQFSNIAILYLWACGSVVVKALRYKPDGRGFETG
jgi:hypothetical protein